MVRSTPVHLALRRMPLSRMSRSRTAAAVLLATLLGWAATAAACPMCASNLPGGDGPTIIESAALGSAADETGQGDLARGFYLSILLMLAAPYAMVVGGGAAFWWHLRRTRATGEPAQPA
jgi:hypothetical protein